MTRTNNRALANTPNNYVSVLDFGAVGDGVTNDAPAIQAAIDAAGNNKTVYFPGGRYLIQDPIILKIGSYLEGMPGGVAVDTDPVNGFKEGACLYLSTTRSDGSAWTESVINPAGHVYNGRVMFVCSPAGGGNRMANLMAISLGANSNNSTFMLTGTNASAPPYERGFLAQHHAFNIRLFTFARGWHGGRMQDAWLVNIGTEQVQTVLSGGDLSRSANGWSSRWVNCIFWKYDVFATWPGTNVDCLFTNCDFVQRGGSYDFSFNNNVTGRAGFSNCNFSTPNLRWSQANITGDLILNFDSCNFNGGSVGWIPDLTITQFRALKFNNCTFKDCSLSHGAQLTSCPLQCTNNTFIGAASVQLKGGGLASYISGNDFTGVDSDVTSPITFRDGALPNRIKVHNNLFRNDAVRPPINNAATQISFKDNLNMEDYESTVPWTPLIARSGPVSPFANGVDTGTTYEEESN